MTPAPLARPWYRRPDLWLPLAVLAAALAVYTATLGPTIDFWDTAEYVTVSHIVGVPHQPGTPLYVLVGRVFDVLLGQPEISEPSYRSAWAVNVMSALFSALAVMMVYLIVVRVARRNDPDAGWLARAGGLTGAVFLMFSDTFWNNAIEAEVYGLAAFMMAMLTWLALVWYEHRREPRSKWGLLLLIYLCGLGVGFHLGSLLVFPAFFYLVWMSTDRRLPVLDLTLVGVGIALFLSSTTYVTDPTVLLTLLILYTLGCLLRAAWPQILHLAGRRDPDGMVWRPFALYGLLLFVAGLTVHVVLMIRAGAVPEPAINQTVPQDFATLMDVLRRTQYPPINPLERQADLWFQLGYYWEFFLRQFSFLPEVDGGSLNRFADRASVLLLPLGLALVGLLHTAVRTRPLVWLLVLGYLINADGLTLYLNFTDHEVRERDYFYFAAFLYTAVFSGLGAAALLRWTSGPLGPSLERLERASMNWPPGRPFHPLGFVFKVSFALAVAVVGVAILPEAAETRWAALFVFGGLFLGLGLSPWVRSLARSDDQAPPAWNERSWPWRLGMGAALAAAVLAGLGLVTLISNGSNPVFAGVLYLFTFGGLFLGYGERREGPRELPEPQWPEPVRADWLSLVAAVAIIGLAALPAVGALDSRWHDKWFTHDRSENRIAYEYAYNILAGLDENAIIFTNGDNDTFPIWYLQEVERFRRDVSVVNLSLVNLGWYVKQLKRFDPPVPMTYTDAEIDELRPVGYRDQETGELVVVMVREYVVKDIIDANRASTTPRPVFFAVTIPRENMERYHAFLQMEGLAYRLTEQRAADGIPETDPDRLLANVYGAYKFDALTTGDTRERKRRFDQMAGWTGDRPRHERLTGVDAPLPVDYWQLLELLGDRRDDVYIDGDTRNLLGNYPASIARAGFRYLAGAEELRLEDGSFRASDDELYDHYTGMALLCYETALRLDPYSALVAAGYYPSLLIERGQTERALAYLETIHGRMEPDLEQSAVLNGMRGLVTIGEEDRAIGWLERRLAAEPGWRLGYELLIRIHESLGNAAEAVAVADLYRENTGEDDPVLRQMVDDLRDRARQEEQRRLREQLEQRGSIPEGQR